MRPDSLSWLNGVHAGPHLWRQLQQGLHQRIQVRQGRRLPAPPAARQAGKMLHQDAVEQLQALAVLSVQAGGVHHPYAADQLRQVSSTATLGQLRSRRREVLGGVGRRGVRWGLCSAQRRHVGSHA